MSASTRRQDLFGNPRSGETAIPGSRGFVGGVKNDATGLTRLGAREYDPLLGTFISVDPVIDPMNPQQLTAYPYASHSPATLTDPSGLIADYDDCRCNYNGNLAKIAAAKEQQFKQSRLNRATYNHEKESIRAYSRKWLQDHRAEQARKAEAAKCDWLCRRGRDVKSVASVVHKGVSSVAAAVHERVKKVVTSDLFGMVGMVIGFAAPICPPCAVVSLGMSVASAVYACQDGISLSCGLNVAGAVLGGAAMKLGKLADDLPHLAVAKVGNPSARAPYAHRMAHAQAAQQSDRAFAGSAAAGFAGAPVQYVGLLHLDERPLFP